MNGARFRAGVSKVRPGGQMRPEGKFHVALSFIPKLFYKRPASTSLSNENNFPEYNFSGFLCSLLSFWRETLFYYIFALLVTLDNLKHLCSEQTPDKSQLILTT